VIEPDEPRRGDELFCRVETASVDPDEDPVTYSYAWTKNDRPMQAGAEAGAARVDGSRVAKGDRWRCAATPSDGIAHGPSGSAERVIANTPPGPALVRVAPATPRANEPLRCELLTKADDVDGDPVRYRFVWQRNGATQSFAESSQEVPPRLVKAGEKWRCAVTPTDGTDDGPTSATEELAIGEGVVETVAEKPQEKAPVKVPAAPLSKRRSSGVISPPR